MSTFLKALKGFNNNKIEHNKWATNYLSKIDNEKFIAINSMVSREQLISNSDNFLSSAEGHEILNKMKDAWSQKRSRDKNNGKKSYNFVMDKGIKNKLGAIAKHHKKTINETMQLLIEERYKQEHLSEEKNNTNTSYPHPIEKFSNNSNIIPDALDRFRRSNRPSTDRGPTRNQRK